jgi:biotin carboxyl carrier protein
MQYNVKIEDKTYTVEIEDLNARPVRAKVDGEVFEVFPDAGSLPSPVKVPLAAQKRGGAENPPPARADSSSNGLLSPLPGTVTEVFVRTGDVVEAGATLLVIEAMKMKNSIRSVRAGKIGAVLVQAGQSVAHKQTLVEFEA